MFYGGLVPAQWDFAGHGPNDGASRRNSEVMDSLQTVEGPLCFPLKGGPMTALGQKQTCAVQIYRLAL